MTKKLLKTTILAIILVVALLGTTVSAATLSANPTEIKAGEEVTVTITVDTAIENADITYEYDSSKFEYVSATAGANMLVAANTDIAGTISLAVAGGDNTTTTVSIILRAKTDVTDGDAAVKVTSYSSNTSEALSNGSVTVKVASETAEEPTPEEPKTNTEEPTTNTGTDTKTGTDGKTITKLPQTGTPIYVGAIALIIIAAGAIVLVKKSK